MRRDSGRGSGRALVALTLCLALCAGCVQPRYRLPAVLGAAGGVLAAGGAVSLVALADRQDARMAAVTTMALGISALITAAVWLGVVIRCQTALDCHEGEVCQPVPTSSGQSYGVCAPGQ